MKVGSAVHLLNGQSPGMVDALSLLAGDENTTFSSLLDLGGGAIVSDRLSDQNREKQGEFVKERPRHDRLSSVSRDPNLRASSNPQDIQLPPSVPATTLSLEFRRNVPGANAEDQPTASVSSVQSTDQIAESSRSHLTNIEDLDASAATLQRVVEGNIPEMLSSPDLSRIESSDLSKSIEIGSQARETTAAISKSSGKQMISPDELSSPEKLGLFQPSLGMVHGVISQQAEGILHSPGISIVEGRELSGREGRPNGEQQNSTADLEARPVNSSVGNLGQTRASTALQGGRGTGSLPTGDGHSQSGADDTHRNSSLVKEVAAGSRFAATREVENDSPGVGTSTIPTHTSSGVASPTHLAPVRDPLPKAQLTETILPRTADRSAARLLGTTMRGDLRVGVQTEAFGRVTIQTNTQAGQLSAQLSLENTRESATLAVHLPAVEQRIVQQHGLNASVRLVGGFDGGTGAGSMAREQSGSEGRDRERYTSNVAIRVGPAEHGSSSESHSVETTVLASKYPAASRLDVTV